jgi:hypothetical protein
LRQSRRQREYNAVSQQDANEQHIAALRTKTREERELIAALNAKLGDALKQRLKTASLQLNDVDQFFLGAEILSEKRTPQRLAQWLAHADLWLDIASMTRKQIEHMADKFGPDARLL